VKQFAPKHQGEFVAQIQSDSKATVDEVFLPVLLGEFIDIDLMPKSQLRKVESVGNELIALASGNTSLSIRFAVNGMQDSALGKFSQGSASLPLI
jgi:hypothetical protein